MAAPSSRSQSSDVQVQAVEVDTGLGHTRDGGHGESGSALSERASIESCSAYLMDFDGGRGSPTRQILRGPKDLGRELHNRTLIVRQFGGITKYIIAIHGLPVDYVEFLRGSSLLEANAVDSMAKRRPTRHLKKTWNQYLCYEYPEQLVNKVYGASEPSHDLTLSKCSPSLDLLDDPPRYSIPESGREVAICRATLRVSPEGRAVAHVLFLDRCLWRNSSALGKAMEDGFVTKPCACNDSTGHSWDLDPATHSEEESSLEHRIWEYLRESDIALDDYNSHLQTCFAQCVYACWADFLDTLTLEGDAQSYMSLLQQLQRSLERNMDAEITLKGEDFSGADWRELLERLERKVRLAAQLSPAAYNHKACHNPQQERVAASKRGEASRSEAEENKQSLDRVTYLGGVLLPITIVSGILAMGDTFGPTGDRFYVFWATAVPLTLLTLAIIYADSIRRVEVWIEEAQSTYESPAAAASGGLLGKKLKKKPLHQGAATPDLEQAVPYSETVTIDYGVPEAPTTTMSEPVTYMAEEPVMVGQPGEQSGGDGQGPRLWKQEELGWLGACKTILGIYKLQDIKKRPRHAYTKTTTTTLE
ncbi:hypothetical protein PG994_002023 [Apiospora phragmitis]|uniref:Uncharacterized protein n=1 Tax=Apiospora phragmitis TaxID=2905665 RepID=A0ABR1WV80_9PEZI